MTMLFSSHEFFIPDGDAFSVAIEAHEYFLGDDCLAENRPEDQRENAKLKISSAKDIWEIEVSIPKDALKKLVHIAQKYLKDGKGDVYMSPVA